MEPSSSSDMEESNSVLQLLRKRLASNDSLSIFKVPRVDDVVLPQKNPSQGTRVSGDVRESQTPTPEHYQQCRQAEASRQGRESHSAFENESMIVLSNEGAPRPIDRGCFRELSAIGDTTPKTNHEFSASPSTSYPLTLRTGVTQLQGNMMQRGPVHSRVLGSHHSPYSVQGSRLADGGNSDKGHYFSLRQNCHPRIAEGASRFEQSGSMSSLLNKGSQSPRGSHGGKVEPDPPSLSTTNILMRKEVRSSKKTRITILLPAMPDTAEKQLITIFFEISKLHGCDFSMDKKGCTLSNEAKSNLLPIGCLTATAQQTTPAGSVSQRESPHTTGRRQRPAPSWHRTFLRTLQSQLHSLGTQLQTIEVSQESPGEGSDTDDPLPLYPEVVMDSPHT